LPPERTPIVCEGDVDRGLFEEVYHAQSPVLGWDTETSGLDAMADDLLVAQVSFQGQPFIVRDLHPRPERLCHLLGDANVLKDFHYAPFDLRFMREAWGQDARNVRCTKLMSKLLHREEGFRHSLAPLLSLHFGIELDKDESVRVGDWGGGLSERQLRYAARDALYLEPLALALEERLRAGGLWALAESCFAHLPTRVRLDLGGYGDVFAY
jgi:ribonuclease D